MSSISAFVSKIHLRSNKALFFLQFFYSKSTYSRLLSHSRHLSRISLACLTRNIHHSSWNTRHGGWYRLGGKTITISKRLLKLWHIWYQKTKKFCYLYVHLYLYCALFHFSFPCVNLHHSIILNLELHLEDVQVRIEGFHMTPYCCPKTMKWQPCWCSKQILFLM